MQGALGQSGGTPATWPRRTGHAAAGICKAGCRASRPPLPPGVPFPPQDVRLEAQNFHVQLRWEPDPRTPGEATYQVEWKRR